MVVSEEVLGGPGRGDAPNRLPGDVDGEDVVVEDAVWVGFPVRDEQDLVPLRRPVERVIVVSVVRQRPRIVADQIDHLDLEPAIVVEARQAFGGAGFEQVARDDHRIAVGLGALRARHAVGDRHARTARRPRQQIAHRREGMVGAQHPAEHERGRAVEPLHEQAGLIVDAAREGDRLAVG
jgi:HPt (histidine-containing phosphotransfer) domain-containing protein